MIIGRYIFRFEYVRLRIHSYQKISDLQPGPKLVRGLAVSDTTRKIMIAFWYSWNPEKPFIVAILSINIVIIGFFVYIVLDETFSVQVLLKASWTMNHGRCNYWSNAMLENLCKVKRIRNPLKSRSLRPNEVKMISI